MKFPQQKHLFTKRVSSTITCHLFCAYLFLLAVWFQSTSITQIKMIVWYWEIWIMVNCNFYDSATCIGILIIYGISGTHSDNHFKNSSSNRIYHPHLCCYSTMSVHIGGVQWSEQNKNIAAKLLQIISLEILQKTTTEGLHAECTSSSLLSSY